MRTRLVYRTAQFLVDILALVAVYVAAFLVRFEGDIPSYIVRTMILTGPYVVAMQYALIVTFGVHRMAWRYIALPDVRRIAYVAAASGTVLIGTRIGFELLAPSYPPIGNAIIPMGVILVETTFAFLGMTCVRVMRRILAERSETSNRDAPAREPVPTILIGAGRAGVLVAKEIAGRPDLCIQPVGFLDDDAVKEGTYVHNVRVLGTTKKLAEICERFGAKQALITVPNASGKEIRRIVALCEEAQIPVKIVPGIFEIVDGTVNLSRIRKVAIEDLLRREPVVLDMAAIAELLEGRAVLVTGAGGSIGSEICRQACRFNPSVVLLLDHTENNLFHIERELRAQWPDVPVVPLIADIRDENRMTHVFREHRPAVVFHAAAHKHVPMMESNPGEAVKNNVLGTKMVAELSHQFGVTEFVLISTDKAVNPTSVMGASKRAAEIFVQALSQRSTTRFVAVRFGNVLGSAGSVVPIFQEQIAAGGPVTVTHPDMQRYFMTIPEACQLVMQAGAMGKGGEIFVLDMGEPVKIVDLARDLIVLSGFRLEDIEIQFSGTRAGEKLFEELSLVEEGAERTRHPKIFIGRLRPHPWADVLARIAELEGAATNGDVALVRRLFTRIVPEYKPLSLLPPAPPDDKAFDVAAEPAAHAVELSTLTA